MGTKVNIRQIAELSGTSASTVSRVLSGKQTGVQISQATREKILAVCRQLDYQPSVHAARLFSRQAKMIGFLHPGQTFIEDDNLARAMSGVYSRLHPAGYRCLPIVYDDLFVEDKEYLNLFKRQEVDALIVWGASEDTVWLDELHEEGKPFLLLANRFRTYPAVTCDQKRGVAAMVERGRACGARRFVYVNVGEGDSCQQRRKGFLESVQGCQAHIVSGGLRIADGFRAVEEILRLAPEAVVCGNDRLAIGVQKGLLEAGRRIPEDILVTGGDNIELSQYGPVPLTTFDQMAAPCARLGTDILLDHLQNEAPLRSELLSPKIHFRQSC